MNGISIGYKPGVSSKSDSKLIKVDSVDSLPTDNVVNGTIGLIQEGENTFEPFTPGIETNALLFDTSFDLLPVLEQFLNEGKWIIVSNSGQESKIYENNNIYIPPNSIFIFGIFGRGSFFVNKSNNYISNISDSNELTSIFALDLQPVTFNFLNNYVKLSSTITLDTLYLIDPETFSITTESVDNYLQLNKWMKCLINNVEDKVSQVYEYDDSWENISKDIILQEKTEFVNSLTPSRIEVTPDEGADALSKVAIDLNTLETQSKTVNITQNGQTTITPDEGKIGLDEVVINTAISTNYEKESLEELNALTDVPNNSIGLITNGGSIVEVYKYSNSSWNKIPLFSDSGSGNSLDSNNNKQIEGSSENNLNNNNYIDDFRITVSTPGYKEE